MRQVRLGAVDVMIERRSDGVIIARSPFALPHYPRSMPERLVHWARTTPDTIFAAQRDAAGAWRKLSYAQVLERVRHIGAALLARGLNEERPLMILSGNDIEHLLLGLAAQYVGIPYAPVSTAYSLVSSDYSKLRHIFNVLTPGLVFAAQGGAYAKAVAAVVPESVELVVTGAPAEGRKATLFADLTSDELAQADAAHARVDGDTIAKFLFTSGSTGLPKGVINTQRMLCSNMEMGAVTFPFLRDEPPVIVDWLPWNHTFGGNHNVGFVLYFGGTIYIDEGKPVPGQIEKTVANLREIAPTVYYNVPKGFEMLVPYLRRDKALREMFFSRLKMTFFAGAGLPQHVWDALEELALETNGERVLMMSGLGATETAPSALFCTPDTMLSGGVGLPVPGLELKLVPNGGKLEARMRGPSITPGYWRQDELTKKAFDEEGFYCLGDALKFVDVNEPKKGFLFDGRVSEDFKLGTGTWVSVGPLRARFIQAFAPYVRDVVVAGHDRDDLSGIVIFDPDACRTLALDLPVGADLKGIAGHAGVRAKFAALLAEFAAGATGSSTKIARLVLLDGQPSIDAGEITDKGSINQRAVLEHRAHLVADLYARERPASVIE